MKTEDTYRCRKCGMTTQVPKGQRPRPKSPTPCPKDLAKGHGWRKEP